MYKVIDILSGKVVCQSTKKMDILLGSNNLAAGHPSLFIKRNWEFRFNPAKGRNGFCQSVEMDFSDLNVSGRDIKPCSRWMHRWNGSEYVVHQISNGPTELRRYQVQDENGRSIDVRMWTSEIEAVTRCARFGSDYMSVTPCHRQSGYRKEPCGVGARRTLHRVGCVSMWKQNVIDGCRYNGHDGEDCVHNPILDHTQARKRVNPINGNTDNVYRFGGGDRCWKNQRGAKQWGKHTPVSRKELAMVRCFKSGFSNILESAG